MLTATVSGSFHRHMEAIASAVEQLVGHSVRVLSPADPRVVAQHGDFLFVASDVVRSVRLVQDRHLESIRAASFLWLVCPDGYVGQSASMELGFAAAVGVPIFATNAPADLTLRQYVRVVPAMEAAICIIKAKPKAREQEALLINPHASVEEAHRILENIDRALTQVNASAEADDVVYSGLANLQSRLRVPYLQ
jgi:hypothetical protein